MNDQNLSKEVRELLPLLDELDPATIEMFPDRNFKQDIVNLRQTRAWNNVGALKRELLDMWGYERNRFVKEAVND